MKFLRDIFEKVKPLGEKNKFLHTTIDGFETFFFAPDRTTTHGAHIRDGIDLKRTMFHVVIAMQLAFMHGMVNVGHFHYAALGLYPGLTDGLIWKFAYGLLQVLPIVIVAHVVGLGIEFFYASKKGHSVEEGFLVSGMLIPLIMPPDVPLWIVGLATAFAVLIAKEAFGGTGMNILNIALTARVFIFFAYPGTISGDVVWVSYDYNILHTILGIKANTLELLGLTAIPEGGMQTLIADGFSGATPLALAAQGGWEAVTEKFSVADMFMGFVPGSIGEVNKLFILLGAGILILTGIGSWKIMVSMVLGTAVTGILMNFLAATAFPDSAFIAVPWYYQFIMGSFFFAMAFMATDPVTAASTDAGKWIYGFMIGALGLIIRVLNPAYPEGWMLAILFMNVFAPLIDHFVIQSNIKRRLSRVAQQGV